MLSAQLLRKRRWVDLSMFSSFGVSGFPISLSNVMQPSCAFQRRGLSENTATADTRNSAQRSHLLKEEPRNFLSVALVVSFNLLPFLGVFTCSPTFKDISPGFALNVPI